MPYNQKYMELAISIAENAKGKCSPNPPVGAVIVANDIVIATGHTQRCGQDHAEVQAIKNMPKNTSTHTELYVTLEPCSHFGKTPPCTQAIIQAGIKNVYAATKDPNPKVNGKGFELLQKAGINVSYPHCEDIVRKQLEYYIKWIETKKPFIILKNATSIDGKIATNCGNSKWITSERAREKVHQLRSEVDAVITTINTVKTDNPTLNARTPSATKQPIRVILDTKLEIDPQSNICKTAKDYQTIVFYDSKLHEKTKITLLEQLSIKTIPVTAHKELLNIDEILTILGAQNITSILVEAGTTLNSYLLKNKYIDKIYYFIAPKILGGTKNAYDDLGIEKWDKQIKLNDIKHEIIDEDILLIGYPRYI